MPLSFIRAEFNAGDESPAGPLGQECKHSFPRELDIYQLKSK